MSQTTSIGYINISYDEDVEKCLRYFRDNWQKSVVTNLFDNARRTDDAKSRFNIEGDGGRGKYVLEHKGGDNFHLSWKYS